jgi:hypothetical protein
MILMTFGRWNDQKSSGSCSGLIRSDAENTRLHSLDSVVEEAAFVVAPLVTSGIWVAVGAYWAVIVGALAALVGTVWLRTLIHTIGTDRVLHGNAGTARKPGAGDPRTVRVLLSRNGTAVLVPMIALGLAMGTLSVGYPVWALERSHAELAGLLVALDSVGGIIAGLVYGRCEDTILSAELPRVFCDGHQSDMIAVWAHADECHAHGLENAMSLLTTVCQLGAVGTAAAAETGTGRTAANRERLFRPGDTTVVALHMHGHCGPPRIGI